MGGPPTTGRYMGWWGHIGSMPQKGVVTYALSPNRQRPTAGMMHAAVFNTFRRFRQQVLFFVPPLFVAYEVMTWASERNEYLNSKAGRAEAGDEE
ncbi:cytochrome b-c1 complex subunit 8 [Lineolata rhizophorae]|uniref:Cytochrome b-c1 complex subunit 8 n=1 Tax=Lineolata rhizophorae TaxID=578093 RepID=A0A6A6NPK5_9PEZI|nr:cytochrome b-c1 complex subunit 8 [Lineolata rhizophorae]